MSKSGCAEDTTSIAMTTALTPTSAIPVGETTHFVAITKGLEGDSGSVDSDDAPCSPVAPLIRPMPVFSLGNGLPGTGEPCPSSQGIGSDIESTKTLSRDIRGLVTAAEGDGNNCREDVVEPVQEVDQEFPFPRKTSLGTTESCGSLELKLEKRRGKMKVTASRMQTMGWLSLLSRLY